MRSLTAALALPLLAASTGCQYLVEVRTDPDEVAWTGYVYADLITEDTPLLQSGAVTATDLDGELVAEGELSESTAGYWGLTVPVDTELVVRVTGEDVLPTVWRTRSPSGRAYWLNGGLLAVAPATLDAYLTEFQAFGGDLPQDLGFGQVAHLWGQPWDPEALTGGTLQVVDGEGDDRAVTALTIDEEGVVALAGPDDPVDLFYAVNLAPGDVTLETVTADGAVASTTWPASGGDLVSALYLGVDGSNPDPDSTR